MNCTPQKRYPAGANTTCEVSKEMRNIIIFVTRTFLCCHPRGHALPDVTLGDPRTGCQRQRHIPPKKQGHTGRRGCCCAEGRRTRCRYWRPRTTHSCSRTRTKTNGTPLLSRCLRPCLIRHLQTIYLSKLRYITHLLPGGTSH